ncbi:FimV/HubP family polar landmark protein [Shewanella sp. YIC-542]|uniref:FimV/HubP family polar landmark protein n=1 Tax=Shewanella mytili TaxID=3377111 RepID=UPI00398F0753
MNFRTSYLTGLTAAFFALSLQCVSLPVQSQSLKVTGPEGQSREQPRQYGPTTPRDTFWSIANQVRPDPSVSIYQVMAAIFEANPHAFSGNNYNSLEKGMILLIPSKATMLAIPKSLAQERAQRDDSHWKQQLAAAKKQKPLAEPTRTAPAAATKPSATQSTATTDAEIPALNVENLQMVNLKLSNELSQTKEQLLRADTENKELQSQIESLQQRVTVLEESLKAAREQVAQLQQHHPEQESANGATPVADPMVADSAENAPVAADEAVTAAQSAAEDTPASVTDAADTRTAPEPAAGNDAPAAAQEPVPAPSNFWRTLMANPLLFGIGALVPLALLLFFLGRYFIRRKSPAEAASGNESDTTAPAETHDDANDLAQDDVGAIRLDGDDELGEQLKDLQQLQPEPDSLPDDAAVADMPQHEMFVDEGDTKANDGFSADDAQSLDDLWAEAMGEQAADSPASAKEEDFDALLDGLEPQEEADDTAVDTAALADEVPVSQAAEPEPEPEPEPENDFIIDFESDPAFASTDTRVDDVAPADNASAEDLSAEIAAALDDDSVADAQEVDDVDALLAALEASPADAPDTALDAETADDMPERAAPVAEDAKDEPRASDAATVVPVIAPGDEPSNDVTTTDAVRATADMAADADVTISAADALESGASQAFAADAEVEEKALESEATPEFSLEDELAKPDEDDDLDALLAELTAAEQTSNAAAPKDVPSEDTATPANAIKEKELGFFDDLKAPKHGVDDASAPAPDLKDELSDDELLKNFAEHEPAVPEDEVYDLHFDEDDNSKLTVDQALAALDADAIAQKPLRPVSDADLSAFQKENGFIDIDKLLNDASEDTPEADPYKSVDVDMGDLDGLVGQQGMVDVDDEENSVNAKLDLARAYIEIDDRDAARALLKEVQIDGNSRQQQEAQSLLKDID